MTERIAYVTKWALTQGILKLRVAVSDGGYAYPVFNGRVQYTSIPASHWFDDEADAKAKALEMQKQHVTKLEAKLAKMRDYTIEVVDRTSDA